MSGGGKTPLCLMLNTFDFFHPPLTFHAKSFEGPPTIMLIVLAFAVLALSRAEVDIITSPGPGNQYVRLQTGYQKDIKSTEPEIAVQIKDEGVTGVQHKYPIKKTESKPIKKDYVNLKAVVNDEGATGILKKSGTVPPFKHIPYDVISKNQNDEGGLDFDDDFHPLNKKKLIPAGSSQASRVNVKKGPNGQDYEYEYVYYYYDDDEEPTSKKSDKEDKEEEPRRRSEQRTEDTKNKYTTIERGRTRGETATTTEQTNEVQRPQRTRGRQMETVDEERLPANTRFPSRGRNSGQTHQTTLPPAHTEIPTRSRTGGNIRRPSLVDSSSFRTHSSDVAPDADQEKYYSRSSDGQNTRESDLEEYVDVIQPTTFSPSTTTTVRPLPPLPEPVKISMPDKAAHDLYAILQQTQEENYVSPGEEVVTTEEIMTTTPTTTTTTTTTTEAPTTTTTTTQAPLPGRGRFRGVNAPRSRPRSSSTEAPKETEEAPKRNKFQPSHSRNQQSSYARRSQKSTTTQAPEESTTARARASFGSNRYRARGRQGQKDETEKTDKTEKTETTTQVASSARPARPKLNISGARPLRPGPRINLRGKNPVTQAPVQESEPTSAQPIHQEAPEHQPAETTTPAPVQQDALSRLRNRPRLRVSPRPHATSTEAPTQPPQSVSESVPEVEEQPEEQQPSTTEQTKPNHLLRRRPNIRRLTIPHSQQQKR